MIDILNVYLENCFIIYNINKIYIVNLKGIT